MASHNQNAAAAAMGGGGGSSDNTALAAPPSLASFCDSRPTTAYTEFDDEKEDEKMDKTDAIMHKMLQTLDGIRRPSSTPSTRAEVIDQGVKEQTPPEEENDDNVEYPRAWKLSVIVLSLCLSIFCMALDTTIIATAIPRITDQFKALDDVGWYASAYLLTTCAFQLFFGKLYTFFSIKWVYLAAFGIFELGSLVCGVAPSSPALIVGRAIAGLGAAGIFNGAILIVAHTVPLKRRPAFFGFFGAMYGLGKLGSQKT